MLKRDVPFLALQNQPATSAPRLWLRGDHRRPGPEVSAGFPRIASPVAAEVRASASDPRLHLADWLCAPENPLTSRVLANRLWQHHFGRGLSQTPSDFGVMGDLPSHPELLDWLASELRDRGWGLKRMHRLIVCSSTYQMASRGEVPGSKFKVPSLETATLNFEPGTLNSALAADPENQFYSRFPRRRLDGESIRDSLLSVSGLVSSERGGPGVMPPLPEELVATLLKGQWTTSQREADHYRRSVYAFARRNLRYPLFEAFDRPDANASCAARNRSTTAPQSLVLFNSEFSLLAARHLAGRILAESTEPARQAELLYQYAYSRPPTPAEAATMAQFLAEQRALLAAENRPASDLALPIGPEPVDRLAAATLVDAALALVNASEFLYVD
ncbi:MAG: DUF1553 domain-containing protein [Pirellulaceae bacterium]|nr:DUF1553 domain-containing protein [Pirellulaceae bacterium]